MNLRFISLASCLLLLASISVNIMENNHRKAPWTYNERKEISFKAFYGKENANEQQMYGQWADDP